MRLDEHKQQVEQAGAKLAAGRKALLNPDGSKIFSDQEHEKREAALHREFRQTIAAASKAAWEAQQEAEEVINRSPADPMNALSRQELELINLRMPLIKEDCETLPLRELAAKAETALRDGDKASIYLYHRYVTRRLNAIPQTRQDQSGQIIRTATNPVDRPEIRALEALTERLAAKLVDPEEVKRREKAVAAAQERSQEAMALWGQVAVDDFLDSRYRRLVPGGE